MTLVYTSPVLFMVAHVKNLLEAEGIACTVRNEFAAAAVGRIPFTECWPELWVDDDTQMEEARRLVAELAGRVEADGDEWRCPACGETVLGHFGQCWNCGAIRENQ